MYLNLPILRFYLAISVVVYHLFNKIAPQAGTQAVFIFFLISGFLVTKLLEETYKSRYKEFVINRILRIYPLYLFSALVGYLVVCNFPDDAEHINTIFKKPSDLNIWLDNIFVFDLYTARERLVPVAWSLNTELSFYLTFLILSFFTIRFRIYFLLAFIPLPFLFVVVGIPFYGHYFGSGIAFSFGSLYYYFRDKIHFTLKIQYIALIMLPIVMYIIPSLLGSNGASINDFGWVLHIFVLFIVIVAFERFLNERGGEVYTFVSNTLGGLSYPIFLLHWPSSVIAYHFFSIEKNSYQHCMTAASITIILSIVSYFLVDVPVMNLRKRIRENTFYSNKNASNVLVSFESAD